MLMDKLRDGAQSRVAKIIFWLIILSFALAGVGSYINRPASNDPAVVDDDVISAQILEQSYQNERARMQAQYGDAAAQLLNNPQYLTQLKKSVLERLVNQSILNSKAQKAGIHLGDEQVKEIIRQMPEFQTDNKFDNQKFVTVLSRAGYTPESFANSMRQDLARQYWLDGVLTTEFALPAEVKRLDALYQQTRDVKMITIPVETFSKQVTVTDQEIEAFYKEHSNEFMQSEQVKLNYVLLDSAELAKTIQPTDSDLKAYYQKNADQFTEPARRKVAHILITEKDDKAAQKKADELLAKLKSGADFAQLAKESSADTLSARQGGELDWFEKGVMDPAFEQAAFALNQKNELSAVVKSSFGYHIIKLLDKQDAIVTPYDKALQVVRQKYSDEKSKELFADQQQKLSDIGFENPDSLDAVVESLKLTLQKTDFITAQQLPAAINVPAIREQAFAENLRDENTNSEVIAVSDTAAVMLHVIDYKPASAKPLTEVKDQVVAKLKATKAAEKARAEAVALLEKVKAGQAIDEQLTKLNAKVEEKKGMARFGTDIPASLAQVVFRLAKPADKMVSAGLYSDELGNQSVLVLEKVISAPESADSPLQQGLSQQVIKLKQEETYGALIEQLRQKADIKYAAETKESTD
ncbi:SurA N-terminal domain-containing protein [Tolumonas osonensis]|uniref:Periplasmic chaperone PpiD n=1 Tax=Tolumonas osonensis TaxID=675874 RepID=A0A841GQM4_9GAMM|nr:SurA N-terminal domain-containing protein [Tolumonas osonensis]MBB6055903.1 peptidyl-prolyl cis-trans isomerase D [Tolumonas osonensis]